MPEPVKFQLLAAKSTPVTQGPIVQESYFISNNKADFVVLHLVPFVYICSSGCLQGHPGAISVVKMLPPDVSRVILPA